MCHAWLLFFYCYRNIKNFLKNFKKRLDFFHKWCIIGCVSGSKCHSFPQSGTKIALFFENGVKWHVFKISFVIGAKHSSLG